MFNLRMCQRVINTQILFQQFKDYQRLTVGRSGIAREGEEQSRGRYSLVHSERNLLSVVVDLII